MVSDTGTPSERVFSIALIGLVALVAGYVFLVSPYFGLTNVRVDGTTSLDADNLLGWAGIDRGDNLLLINLTDGVRRLKEHAPIADAALHRIWPRGLRIVVHERRPVALLPVANGFATLSESGVVVSLRDIPAGSLPVLTGLDRPSVTEGQVLSSANMRLAATVAGVLYSHLGHRISEINVDNIEQMVVYTRDLIKIYLGAPEEIERKTRVLASMLRELDDRGTRVVTMDLRAPGNQVVK